MQCHLVLRFSLRVTHAISTVTRTSSFPYLDLSTVTFAHLILDVDLSEMYDSDTPIIGRGELSHVCELNF